MIIKCEARTGANSEVFDLTTDRDLRVVIPDVHANTYNLYSDWDGQEPEFHLFRTVQESSLGVSRSVHVEHARQDLTADVLLTAPDADRGVSKLTVPNLVDTAEPSVVIDELRHTTGAGSLNPPVEVKNVRTDEPISGE